MQRDMSGLIPTGEDRCYLPFTTEPMASGDALCPDNGARPCTCINPKHHLRADPGGAHGCHCGRRWGADGVQLDAPGWGQP